MKPDMKIFDMMKRTVLLLAVMSAAVAASSCSCGHHMAQPISAF